MKAERWQEIEVVLQEALDRPPLQRASFLETACAGDDELKAEATTLIAAYEEAGDFIEQPAIAQDAYVLLGNDAHVAREIVIAPTSQDGTFDIAAYFPCFKNRAGVI